MLVCSVTGFCHSLPVSQGMAVILVMVDHISKACKFIPLPKLISAKETADLLLQHVVWVHGLPNDVV